MKEWLGDKLKDKWHIILFLLWVVWAVSAYKTSLETHLSDIDSRLDNQGTAIQWLVRHTPAQVQQDAPPVLDRPMRTKPQSYAIPPNLTGSISEDAGIPPTINER